MSVTVDDVLWCYRLLLGREPESETVVQDYLQSADRLSLLRSFLASTEFQKRLPDHRQVQASLNRFTDQALRIDTEVTEVQFEALVQRVQACWSRLGLTQPHWSVMSNPLYRPDRIDESIEHFWSTGRQPVMALKRILARIGFGELQDKTCVEYGCGLGRMTAFLAPEFGQVHGYDISANHLALAQTRIAELGIGNVILHLAAELPAARPQACDVYYTRLVLQHNPPPLIRRMLVSALEALKPGGVAVFQVATHIVGYHFDIEEYLRTPPEAANEFEIHCLPQQAIFELVARGGCDLLEVHEDGAAGSPAVCVSNLFVVRKRVGRLARLRAGLTA